MSFDKLAGLRAKLPPGKSGAPAAKAVQPMDSIGGAPKGDEPVTSDLQLNRNHPMLCSGWTAQVTVNPENRRGAIVVEVNVFENGRSIGGPDNVTLGTSKAIMRGDSGEVAAWKWYLWGIAPRPKGAIPLYAMDKGLPADHPEWRQRADRAESLLAARLRAEDEYKRLTAEMNREAEEDRIKDLPFSKARVTLNEWRDIAHNHSKIFQAGIKFGVRVARGQYNIDSDWDGYSYELNTWKRHYIDFKCYVTKAEIEALKEEYAGQEHVERRSTPGSDERDQFGYRDEGTFYSVRTPMWEIKLRQLQEKKKKEYHEFAYNQNDRLKREQKAFELGLVVGYLSRRPR